MKKLIAILFFSASFSASASNLTHDDISFLCKRDDVCIDAFKAYAYTSMLKGRVQGECDAGDDKFYDPETCAKARMENEILKIAGKEAIKRFKKDIYSVNSNENK